MRSYVVSPMRELVDDRRELVMVEIEHPFVTKLRSDGGKRLGKSERARSSRRGTLRLGATNNPEEEGWSKISSGSCLFVPA